MIDLLLAVIFSIAYQAIVGPLNTIQDWLMMIACYFLTNFISSVIDELLGIDPGGK